jgi:hypothetical protein
MGAFLLGILADEAMRRWIIPWIRKDRARGNLLGQLCGAYVGARLAGGFHPASTDGMYYMSGHGGDGGGPDGGPPPGYPPPGYAPPPPPPHRDFTEILKEDAARALVDSFAHELMSGALGPVDRQCQVALNGHLQRHKARCAVMGFGFHNPFRHHSSAPGLPAAPLPGPTPDNPDAAAPPPDDGGAAAAVAGMLGMTLGQFNAMVPPTGERAKRHGHHHRHRHGHHRHGGGHAGNPANNNPAVMGWGLSSLNPWGSSTGRLLVSAVPGGVAATQAHDIAKRALRDGSLKPEHLHKASDLVKRGKHGDQAALVKIATIKHHAGRGDPNAAVALDRLKLAHSIHSGQPIRQSHGHGGKLRQHYQAGSELMHLHPHRAA